MNGKAAIDVRGLSKRFGDRVVVDDLTIRVPKGSICGFLGPNGSGKTTTIRLLCGLLTPDGGSGTCLGYDIIEEAAAIKREVGYMTQHFSLYGDLSIRENLEFVARMYGLPDRRRAVDDALDGLGLGDRQHQLAETLSGGWKQRLALAACILHKPRLLLLDEPTAGVDPKARREFWDQIHRLAADGMTVLVSTHYMDEAERCHIIAYIAYGKLLAFGSADEVARGSNLKIWRVVAPNPATLAASLAGQNGIDTVVPFGKTLHVGGRDPARLDDAIRPYRDDPTLSWTAIEPDLEDVFIALMSEQRPGNGPS